MRWWWLNDLSRLRAERTAVETLAAEEGWFTLTAWRISEFRFSADGVITAHGIGYPCLLYTSPSPRD